MIIELFMNSLKKLKIKNLTNKDYQNLINLKMIDATKSYGIKLIQDQM